MTELLIVGIVCLISGIAIGMAVYDYLSRNREEKDNSRQFPRCTCHDPQHCDIHCIGKENFYRYHP